MKNFPSLIIWQRIYKLPHCCMRIHRISLFYLLGSLFAWIRTHISSMRASLRISKLRPPRLRVRSNWLRILLPLSSQNKFFACILNFFTGDFELWVLFRNLNWVFFWYDFRRSLLLFEWIGKFLNSGRFLVSLLCLDRSICMFERLICLVKIRRIVFDRCWHFIFSWI